MKIKVTVAKFLMEPTNNSTFNLVIKEISQNSKLKIREKVKVPWNKLNKLKIIRFLLQDRHWIKWTAQITITRVSIFREIGLLLEIMKKFQI